MDMFNIRPTDILSSDEQALVLERLEELGNISDGWLDGTGVAPNEYAMSWCKQNLLVMMDMFGIKRPCLFPIPDGGIEVEWSSEKADITLYVGGEDNSIVLEVETYV